MSAATAARYQQESENRMRGFLLDWLSTLPPDGWRGTVPALFEELEAYRLGAGSKWRFLVYVPSGSALTKALKFHAAALTAAGWRVESWRTKAARLVGVAPIGG